MLSAKQRIGRLIFGHLPVTRFLFDQFRLEWNAGMIGIANILGPAQRRTLARLRRVHGVLVNVACGPNALSGFVNLDLFPTANGVVRFDCRLRLPFANGAVDGIRVEHFVEHLDVREELPALLRDAVRVLRPGGVLRIIVPDAGRYLHAYCTQDLSGFRALGFSEPFPEDLPTRMDIVNHVFHQWHEHRWAYDFDTLADRLRRAGFSHIEQSAFQQCRDPRLAQDAPNHAPYSLYVDAVKQDC
jgi:predicted SAM-dependent methyltransferase